MQTKSRKNRIAFENAFVKLASHGYLHYRILHKLLYFLILNILNKKPFPLSVGPFFKFLITDFCTGFSAILPSLI